jgi:hypothetical protein
MFGGDEDARVGRLASAKEQNVATSRNCSTVRLSEHSFRMRSNAPMMRRLKVHRLRAVNRYALPPT